MKACRQSGFCRILQVLVAVFACSIMFGARQVSAAALSEDELYRKALLNAMYNCYKSEEMVLSVDTGGPNAYESFRNSILRRKDKTDKLYIPTGIGDGNNLALQKSGGTRIGCRELFLGDPDDGLWYGIGPGEEGYEGEMKGLFDLYNIKTPEDPSVNKVNDPNILGGFLNRLGYTKTEPATSGSGGGCCRYGMFKY